MVEDPDTDVVAAAVLSWFTMRSNNDDFPPLCVRSYNSVSFRLNKHDMHTYVISSEIRQEARIQLRNALALSLKVPLTFSVRNEEFLHSRLEHRAHSRCSGGRTGSGGGQLACEVSFVDG